VTAKLNLAATATAASALASAPTATRQVTAPTVQWTPPAQTTATPADAEAVGQATPQVSATSATPAVGVASGSEVTYEVRWGDTLSRIAARYATTISAIVARNPQIVDRNRVYAGSVLIVPSGSSTAGGTAPVAQETGEYTIQRGDTLATIAHRFGTTVTALMQANPSITNVNYIQAGRRLVIPVGGDWTAPRTHIVLAGETLSSIARQYGTTVWAIVVHNNLANANLIYAGQRLVIP